MSYEEVSGSAINPADFRFYFICFTMGGMGIGNMVLLQKKPDPGSVDSGFNFVSVIQFLIDRYGTAVVITFHNETTYERYLQWKSLLSGPWASRFKINKGLTVVAGDGVLKTDPKGNLKSVCPQCSETECKCPDLPQR